MNSRLDLLNLFPDNNTQEIEAKDIRAFVNAVYDEMVIKGEDVVDNLQTVSSDLPLSANQGRLLNLNKENNLGVPSQDDFILSSTASGTRNWKKLNELQDLDNVVLKNVKNNQILRYDEMHQIFYNDDEDKNPYLEVGGVSWHNILEYERDTVVGWGGAVYLSKKYVPANTDPKLNPEYWELINDVEKLSDLKDVDFDVARNGDYLKSDQYGIFKVSNFENDVKLFFNNVQGNNGIDVSVNPTTQVDITLNANLNNLNDVFTAPQEGDVLYFSNGDWGNRSFDELNVDKTGTAWKPDIYYESGDIVSFADRIYLCDVSNIDHSPIDTRYWEPLKLIDLGDTDIANHQHYELIYWDDVIKKYRNIPSTDISTGYNEGGHLVRLAQNGKIDPSMIERDYYHRVASHDPTIEEYPDTTGETYGAFWDIKFTDENITAYTYTTGDLTGKTVKTGDFIVWGTDFWYIVPALMNPLDYYKRDGSQPLTGDLQANGYRLKNVMEGVDLLDGVNIKQLQTKENSLGNPVADGMYLTSQRDGTRNWVNLPDVDGAIWGNITGDINNQYDLIVLLATKANKNDVFNKTEYIDQSTGNTDAGKPIILNNDGKIDQSMIDIEALHFVGEWTPTAGNEYPDVTNETPGAFWNIVGIPGSGEYIFQGGDLVGRMIKNGDFIIYGSDSWGIIENSVDPDLYYHLDGSRSITGPFAGGNQQIKNIAPGTDNTDAINLQQHKIHTENYYNPHRVTKQQIGLGNVENLSPEDLPISDDTQLALNGKENYLGLPLQDDMVLISKTDGTRQWVENTGGEWGQISGDINNQTDLMDEFDKKVNTAGDRITGDLIIDGTNTSGYLKLGVFNNESVIEFSNTTGGNVPRIYWDNLQRALKVDDLTGDGNYLLHTGNVNPDDYLKRSGGTMYGDLILNTDVLTEDLQAAPRKYVDDSISSAIDGAMYKSVYDTNDNGIVDLSEDSQRLGGELPDYYGTKTEVDSKVSKSGDIMTGDLGVDANLTVTGESHFEKVDANFLKINVYPGNVTQSIIEFSDQENLNWKPSIYWNSSTKEFNLDTHTNTNYRIWHSGNFNPDSLNPIVRKTFFGDGSTTVFEIPERYTPNNANVYYNGVRIFEPEDVDISSGTEIVFTEAPQTGDRIDFEGFKNPLIV